ncbi:MAG: hypothetical protein ABR520_11270 [Mycobacteriales bacterium]
MGRAAAELAVVPAMKFTRPHAGTLRDPMAETIRGVQDQQIAELQDAARAVDTALTAGMRLLRGPTLLTASSGTHQLAEGTCLVVGITQGAGGGGGGAGGGVNQAAGAGGGAGITLHWTRGEPGVRIANRSCPYTCGAGGAGGANTGGTGGTGGDAQITVTGIPFVAKGGGGGGGLASTALGTVFGGVGQPGSSGYPGTFTTALRGNMGFVVGGAGFSGAGGASPFGISGAPGLLGDGGAAAGFGAGGGGGNATAAGKVGGTGTGGCHQIWEFG